MTSTSVIANVIPPSDNSGSTVVSPNIATTLTKKQKKAIAVAEQKELNLARISSANKTILSYDDAMVMTTSPDVKPFIKATDMNISNNNTFRIGDYVDVQADFSAWYSVIGSLTGRDVTGCEGTGWDRTGWDGTGRDGTGQDGMGWDGT